MSTENSAGLFEVMPISDWATLDETMRSSAIATYKGAFGQYPYCEKYSDQEVEGVLRRIVNQGGNLMLGVLGGRTVSLAGGYLKPDGSYYIEELAVAPGEQANGYGRATLRSLLETPAAANAPRLGVRTAVANERAVRLYTSEGFTPEPGTEMAASWRQIGAPGIDERVYLSKPPTSVAERLSTLKRVTVAYPSGNATAIVFDQLLTADRKSLNDGVIGAWKARNDGSPGIEQCCFVTFANDPRAVARMEMFGGEFCGNATRSVVWLVTGGKNCEGLIEASGVERPLQFKVKDGDVSVEMPLPQKGKLTTEVAEGMLVQLDGIAQLVVTDKRIKQRDPREVLTELLRSNAYGLADQPAVGVSYYDPATGKADFCVWVKAVETVFDETACGSGTSAIGVAMATQKRSSIKLPVIQPSGETITTEAAFRGGKVSSSVITGKVGILYDGELVLA